MESPFMGHEDLPSSFVIAEPQMWKLWVRGPEFALQGDTSKDDQPLQTVTDLPDKLYTALHPSIAKVRLDIRNTKNPFNEAGPEIVKLTTELTIKKTRN